MSEGGWALHSHGQLPGSLKSEGKMEDQRDGTSNHSREPTNVIAVQIESSVAHLESFECTKLAVQSPLVQTTLIYCARLAQCIIRNNLTLFHKP
jgi:hypothetical protein